MRGFVDYYKYLYKVRYFWAFLARQDLIARNRRSKLGLIWLMVQPFILTLMLAVVFSAVFNASVREFVPYVYIGAVMWELIASSATTGGGAFQTASQYIRQYSHRVTIYSLRSALVYTIIYVIASIGVFIWIAAVNPKNIPIGLLTYPLTVALLFCLSWSITTIAAFINVKYRDYQQIMTLVMQALWYFSPVFMQEEIFKSRPWLMRIFSANPITRLLYLQRKPLLYGSFPAAADYLVTVATIAVFAAAAFAINKRYEKSVIFYL